MVFRLLLIVLLAGAVSGCATTRQKSSTEQLQVKVAELENQVAERDEEIADLQDELDYLQRESKRRDRGIEAEEVSTKLSKKDAEIIRVGVSAGQVQIALKKAGYYNGAIDSRVGSGTKKAIKQFQQDNDLKADGVIGRQTWEKLKTYLE